MTIVKTLGGDRLGSGKKMKQNLHGYERSTHDLSRRWKSTMQIGMLVPCFRQPALNGDTFEIKIRHKLITAPTNGPTFGVFKIQIDMFVAATRLYNGLLHNNAVKVGMDMGKIMYPTAILESQYLNPKICERLGVDYNTHQIASDSLLAYIGIRGIGRPIDPYNQNTTSPTAAGSYTMTVQKQIMYALMYYDIVKNYYANQQEGVMYYVEPELAIKTGSSYSVRNIWINPVNGYQAAGSSKRITTSYGEQKLIASGEYIGGYKTNQDSENPGLSSNTIPVTFIDGTAMTGNVILLDGSDRINNNLLQQITINGTWINNDWKKYTFAAALSLIVRTTAYTKENQFVFRLDGNKILGLNQTAMAGAQLEGARGIIITAISIKTTTTATENNITLNSCPLENIDEMRRFLLQQQKGLPMIINNATNTTGGKLAPYNVIYENYTNPVTNGKTLKMASRYAGLCVKTYQSDIFNNWLSQEWIDGTNGISAITNIDVSEGLLNLDVLNIMQKTYNVLNRIAVAGGTYEDWQEAVYGVKAIRRAESPVYVGGCSSKLGFAEVISTGGEEPIGTIKGRGVVGDEKGGHIYIKTDEPSMIMGICSITPYIDYSQGNDWFNDLISEDDLHKPGYDRIGFQNLITGQMAWWDEAQNSITPAQSTTRQRYSAGKQPSWIHYQTAVDEAFGAFAEENNMMFMTLNRRYEPNNETTQPGSIIEDLTTYIQPGKYNYIFADTSITAQNFWMQIEFDVKYRSIMSANQIPNL